jgi:hypothetical protein
VPQLTGTIQRTVYATVADFIDQLNEQTTREAEVRLQHGKRPHLIRAALSAAGRFIRSYVLDRGFVDGWAGLQLSILESIFRWLEEAKLHQLAADFRAANAPSAVNEKQQLPFLPAAKSAATKAPWTKAA